ncbi:arginine deiminase [Streptomyces sp. NPDC047000]|uniref:arginine deiminase n=1 Tax=Streptomyces sp. NPDC047000 TaxID=3155474 RepID=UPI0033FCB60E
MPFHVDSEAGVLRQVILHEPGLEMQRLTPSNKDGLLFDDVLWVPQAREEHQTFQRTLREQGVTVHLLKDLLTETLKESEAQEFVLDRVLDERQELVGGGLSRLAYGVLRDLPSDTLADHLIGGINKREFKALAGSTIPRTLGLEALEDYEFLLTPLPNHLFTRDTSCWMYSGVSINPMMMRARKRETVHYEAIYRYHPMFADQDFPLWSPGEEQAPATIEGGDVEVIGNGTVLIGLSERTTPAGVELVSRSLFAHDAASRVIAVELPKARSCMHLDTVMTMVDRDVFTLYSELDPDSLRSWTLTPSTGPTGITVKENRSFFDEIADALGLNTVRVLRTEQDPYAAQREQWNDGCNVLTVSPGKVVAYSRNEVANQMLRDNGIDVLTVPGSELGRGRGGPRCMSCPIEREPVPAAS